MAWLIGLHSKVFVLCYITNTKSKINEMMPLKTSIVLCCLFMKVTIGFAPVPTCKIAHTYSSTKHPTSQILALQAIPNKKKEEFWLYPSLPYNNTNITPQKRDHRSSSSTTILSQSSTGLDIIYSDEGSLTEIITQSPNNAEMTHIRSRYTLESSYAINNDEIGHISQILNLEALKTLLCSSCLITSNTVGASMLVLPEAVISAGIIIPAIVTLGKIFSFLYPQWNALLFYHV